MAKHNHKQQQIRASPIKPRGKVNAKFKKPSRMENRKKVLAPPSPISRKDIAKSKSNIGKLKFEAEDFESAHSFYLETYHILKDEYGDDSLCTCIAAFNVGRSLRCLGKPTAALTFYDLFSKFMFASKDFQDLPEDYILSLQYIAWSFYQDRSLEYANTFYKITLAAAIEALGETHEIVARVFNQCGNLSFDFGNITVAIQCYEKSFEIENKLSSKCSNLNLLMIKTNIAHAHEINGSLQKSLESFEEILESLKSVNDKLLGSNVADMQLCIARLQRKLERPDLALEALTSALIEQKQKNGDIHRLVAATYNEIAIIEVGEKRIISALDNFHESLRIRKILKDSNLKCSTVLFNIARTHVQAGEYDKAQEYFDKLIQWGGS